MRKLLLILVALCGAATAQAATPACAAGGTAVTTGVGATTFTDATVVSGQTYGYLVTADTQFGSSCSTIVNAVIPAGGAHSVKLTWVASTTVGVTYSVFRAQAPAPPTGLGDTVN